MFIGSGGIIGILLLLYTVISLSLVCRTFHVKVSWISQEWNELTESNPAIVPAARQRS
jgi:hypothetical protein